MEADRRVIGPVGTSQTPLVDYPCECPRRDTVAALWDRIQQVGVVHVRGSPASRKSTLACLLEKLVRMTGPICWYMDSLGPPLSQMDSGQVANTTNCLTSLRNKTQMIGGESKSY
jgi:hypothetical protein